MSVDSPPLGATRSGAFELRAPALEAPDPGSAVADRAARTRGDARPRACWSRSRPRAPTSSCRRRSWSGAPIGLAGSFGSTGINLGSVGLTVTARADVRRPTSSPSRVARRLSPLLVLGCYRRAARADPARAAAGSRPTSSATSSTAGSAQMYHVNPYLRGPARARRSIRSISTSGPSGSPHPPSTARCSPRSATCWRRCRSPASVFAYKAIAAVSSLAIVALVWNGARLRGVDPVKAAALVGLNPLIVVYGVGGGHNDLLMLAPMVAGVVLHPPAPRPTRRAARSSSAPRSR